MNSFSEATPARSVQVQGFDLPYGAAPVTLVADRYAISYGAPADDQVDQVLTMSSLEIAELTGKRHDNVIVDIRAMMESLGYAALTFQGYYKGANGKQLPLFNLPRDLTETLITGYSIPLRHKVIVRLRELENQVAKPTPANLNDPAALRGLLLGYTEQVLQLEHQVGVQAEKIEQDAPKVEVYHKIADSTGLIGFQKFCTQLGLKQREVKHWMKEIGWFRVHQYAVNPLPTAMAVDRGYCQIRNYTTDSGKLVQGVWFTGKAVTYVAQEAPEWIRKNGKKAA